VKVWFAKSVRHPARDGPHLSDGLSRWQQTCFLDRHRTTQRDTNRLEDDNAVQKDGAFAETWWNGGSASHRASWTGRGATSTRSAVWTWARGAGAIRGWCAVGVWCRRIGGRRGRSATSARVCSPSPSLSVSILRSATAAGLLPELLLRLPPLLIPCQRGHGHRAWRNHPLDYMKSECLADFVPQYTS
jgi:hypothetical protein